MGSIFSAIGRGINAVISAIAGVLMAIVGAITMVRSSSSILNFTRLTHLQVIVTIFDVIFDILCCRCGSRRSGSRYARRRRGRRGAAAY
ncbi:hypothetical protein C8R45DRAFT_1037956 [Mycena sanguinolenta]|nr:hypothetical protein C8R45DRAFT_1037956 [Mycena sanguinolenta]